MVTLKVMQAVLFRNGIEVERRFLHQAEATLQLIYPEKHIYNVAIIWSTTRPTGWKSLSGWRRSSRVD